MARADRRRTKRTKPAPGIRASGQASVVEQTLFFTRIRRQAKWAFVLLVLAFGIGFVAFGVGSDIQGGIADVIGQRGGGSSGPSAEDARERLAENPQDAKALRDLATALQQEGKPDEAVQPLERLTQLQPKNDEALRELAALYLGRAARARDALQQAQIEAQFLSPSATFLPPQTTTLGQALADQPVENALASRANERVTTVLQEFRGAYSSAQQVYQRLVVLDPEDAEVQLQLADAAFNAGDTTVAIGALRQFLKLAPEDPRAPQVEAQIKQLQAQAGIDSGG